MKPLLAALLLAAAPLPAQEVRLVDLPRLERFDATLGRALAGAFASGAPEDVRLLAQALSGTPGPLAPEGDWSCRTLKLGGLLPLTAYPPFRCRIAPAGEGAWTLEKLTGSQRLQGTIRVQDGPALYLGTGYVDGGPAQPYDAFPPDEQLAIDPGQTIPQVGLFEQAGPDQARLLLPQPLLESELDILWLTR